MPVAIPVDAPPSLPPARPSILRSKSNSDVSTISSDSKASSITFAPLPCIEARKRRNSRPIGLASRAEMLRKTRRQFVTHVNAYEEQQRSPEDDDIPLPDFGKLVKGLWRTVSRGQGTKDSNSREVSRPPNMTTATEGINTSAAEEDEGEGGVWMEEITWSPLSNSAPFSREDHLKRNIRRDTFSTVDTGAFLDGLEGFKEVQAKQEALEFPLRGEGNELGSHNDLGSSMTETITVV